VRKKICIVASYAPSILNFRKELILELLKTCDVYACAPFISAAVQAEIERLGVTCLHVQMSADNINPLANLKYLHALFRHFRAIKPDIVLGYTIKPVIWGSLAAKIANVRYIASMITGLGYSFTELRSIKRKSINKLVCALYRFSLRFNQMVLFQNQDDKQLFQRSNLLNKTPSIIIHGSGVNLTHFSRIDSFPEKMTFLMIGRLLKDKGIYEYIEAARRIKKLYNNIEFNLVGWIDDNPSSIQAHELDDWQKEGLVNYLGQLDDVRDSIKAASVFVLPSYREGTPRSVLEAMSMGRAIITTDAPGCRETVINGMNGFLVPVKSIDELVLCMKKFIDNTELVIQFGRQSREIAVNKYDVEKVNASIISALHL
jgi:glycosyltransferase involved in cell wall biosynthesis